MKLRKFFYGVMIALAMLILILPPRAFAQTPDRLASLTISIWPEYDTSSVLVILDGVLADTASFPREISLLLPSKASLLAATWRNTAGTPAAEEPFKTTDLGDGYTRVTYTVHTPRIYLEYYDDLLRGAPDKTMDFAYKSIGALDSVTLEIQQPLKATNFAVTPATQTTRTDSDGFKYFSYAFSNIAAGQTIAVQAKYTKTDPNPSVQSAPQPTPVPVPIAAPTTNESNNLFLLIGLVVVGVAAILGFFLWQQRSQDRRPVSNVGANRRHRKPRGGAATATVFCTQCGRALGPEDNFCPKCGTKRRAQQ